MKNKTMKQQLLRTLLIYQIQTIIIMNKSTSDEDTTDTTEEHDDGSSIDYSDYKIHHLFY
jgi:hypothetical protein